MGNFLRDWQNATNPPISYEIKQQYDRIDIEFLNGRSIWIELQDDVVRVHCYDEEHDPPVNVEIHKHKVEVDTHDYETES